MILCTILACWAFNATRAHASSTESIITTLYAYPTQSSWQLVEQSAPTVKFAIVNICAPDGSGPGCNDSPATAENPDWPPTISALEKAGIIPLYYLSTNYGKNSISTLESELQQAITWYGIASPHWDTMQPDGTCDNGGNPIPCTTYNADLYNYAMSVGAAAVMYNPGTTYGLSISDMFGPKEIVEVFEGSAATFETTTFPSWMSSYAADQFVVTLSAGSAATIGNDIAYAVHNNIGNIYEDDESEPPSYSTLPTFWDTEVSDVAAYTNNSPSPTPSSTPSGTSSSNTSQQTMPSTQPSDNSAGVQQAPSSGITKPHPQSATSNSSLIANTSTGQTVGARRAPTNSANPFIRLSDTLAKYYIGHRKAAAISIISVFLVPVAFFAFLWRTRINTLLSLLITSLRTRS